MAFPVSRRSGVESVLCRLGCAVRRAQGMTLVELVVSPWQRFCLKRPRVRRKSTGLRDLLTTGARLEDRSLLAAFVVTSAADNTIASDGLTTLREAIIAANGAGAGPHTITFGNGSATLGGTDFTDTTPDTITLSLGEMEITESLTITGQSAANTIIDGNNASRMFSVTRGDTTLEKLTLTRGRTSAILGAGRGGAIRSTSTGTLTLNQCTLSGNSTVGDYAIGGAIFALGAVTVSESTLSGNSTAGRDAEGAAIYTYSGAVTVSQSTLSGNFTTGAFADGGAIYSDGGAVTVIQSTLSGNSTAGSYARGGAIGSGGGTVTVSQSTLSGNFTTGSGSYGGAIVSVGGVTVSESTLSGNFTATTDNDASGGAIFAVHGGVTVSQSTLFGNSTAGQFSRGGAISSTFGAVTVSRSTLSGNSTTGNRSEGGAIYSVFGAVTVSQSTLSGNFTVGNASGGGAIFTSSGAVTVSQSTLSGNSTAANSAYGGALRTNSGAVTVIQSTLTGNHSDLAPGGGIFSDYSTVTVTNSIVAGNTDNGTAPDIRKASRFLLTVSHSLIGDNTGTGLFEANAADAAGNFIGSATGAGIIDPRLGPLQNNGGPTLTHALLPGSLAINHGDNTLVPTDTLDLNSNLITNESVPFDQRGQGFSRILGGTVDMGAVESTANRSPEFTGPLQFAFEEFAPRWTLIGRVSASASEGQGVTFSVVGGNPDGTLYVGSDGRILVDKPDLTGLRHRSSFNLVIRATDASPNALTTDTNVQVFITPAQGTRIDPLVDGAAGAGGTVDASGTGMLVQGGATPSRGVLEFDLSALPTNRPLKNAFLYFSTGSLVGGTTVNVPIDVFGYAGNGVVDAADASAGVKIGARPITNAGGSNQIKVHSAQLDADFVRNLIGAGQLGLVLRNDATSDGVIVNTLESSASPGGKPYLVLQFGDDQGTVVVCDVGATGNGHEFVTLASNGASFTTNTANVFAAGAWEQFVTGDFDGNGHGDIAGRMTTDGSWWVSLANSSGVHQTAVQWGAWSTVTTWSRLLVADFDNDGRADIAGRDANGDWWVNLSTGTAFDQQLWGNWTTATTWSDVLTGDFNRDGRADIAGRNSSGQWFVARSTGTGFVSSQWGLWSSSTVWSDVQVGDFNGDGRDDIAGRSTIGQWWVNRSNGNTFGAAVHYGIWSTATVWSDVRVGDFNGDGLDDIVGRSAIGQWWGAETRAKGFTMKLLGQRTAPQSQWGEMVVGDFNRDGRADIATRNTVDHTVWVSLLTITGNTPSFVTNNWATLPTAGSPQWRFLKSGRLNR